MTRDSHSIKIAADDFCQIFIVGYVTILLLFLAWSGSSDYGWTRTIADLWNIHNAVVLLRSPLLWLPPLILASLIATNRLSVYKRQRSTQGRCSLTDKFIRTSILPKVVAVSTVALVMSYLWIPAPDVQGNRKVLMQNFALDINEAKVYTLIDEVLSDGHVTTEEFINYLELLRSYP